MTPTNTKLSHFQSDTSNVLRHGETDAEGTGEVPLGGLYFADRRRKVSGAIGVFPYSFMRITTLPVIKLIGVSTSIKAIP